MVDEIFDRSYQSGRAELNAGIDRALRRDRPRARQEPRRNPPVRVERPLGGQSKESDAPEALELQRR